MAAVAASRVGMEMRARSTTGAILKGSVRVGPGGEDLELDAERDGRRALEMPGRNMADYEMDKNQHNIFSEKQYKYRNDDEDRTLVEEVDAVRRRLKEMTGWIIDPGSKFCQKWDTVTFCALLFTAVVTPVEVAFTGTKPLQVPDEVPLLVMNRLVDAVFISDFCLQFFMGYDNGDGIVVKSPRRIAARYLKGWAFIDFISSFPLETIMFFVSTGGASQFFKIFRLLRLLKLARVIRASRILARWEAAAVFAFTYTEISIYKFFFTLVLYAHWNACIWGMVAHPDIQSSYNWMYKLEQTQAQHKGYTRCVWDERYDLSGSRRNETLGPHSVPTPRLFADGTYRTPRFKQACFSENVVFHFDRTNVRHKYCASLYFAVYTMTGIGFGDITATGHIEVVVAILIMLSGAVFWAYMIGQFVTLVSHMDIYGNAFRQRMDELNYMMADRKFSYSLKRRCRMFLLHSKEHQRQVNYRQLEKIMSISLRDEVAAANNKWINTVWYLREVSPPFVVDLSQAIQSLVYAPTEVIDLGLSLFIITNGIAARKGRIISRDGVWGEDFMLDNVELIDMICTAALSYLEVICLSREKMIKILALPMHENERKIIRMSVVFYTVKARFMAIGAEALARRLRTERAAKKRARGEGSLLCDRRPSAWNLFGSRDHDVAGDETPNQRREREAIAKRRRTLAATMTFVEDPNEPPALKRRASFSRRGTLDRRASFDRRSSLAAGGASPDDASAGDPYAAAAGSTPLGSARPSLADRPESPDSEGGPSPGRVRGYDESDDPRDGDDPHLALLRDQVGEVRGTLGILARDALVDRRANEKTAARLENSVGDLSRKMDQIVGLLQGGRSLEPPPSSARAEAPDDDRGRKSAASSPRQIRVGSARL